MKHLKLFLIIGFSLLITTISYGQVLKFKATSVSFKFKTESRWGEWLEPKESSVLIVMNTDDDRFTIYSKEKQTYDIVEYEGEKTDSDGDNVWSFYCVNEDGNTCRVKLMKLNSQDERLQLYVSFNDVLLVYNIYSLD